MYDHKIHIRGHQRYWGDWQFHASGGGLQVNTELFHNGGARVVATIEHYGSWEDIDDANYDWFEWDPCGTGTRRVSMGHLPNVGDTV